MSKYTRLSDYLESLDSPVLHVDFRQLERILGFRLPDSARRHPAWWANNVTQSGRHASAWLLTGWKTEDLNLSAETVTFARTNGSRPPSPSPALKRAAVELPDLMKLPIAPGSNPMDVSVQFTWRTLGVIELNDGRLSFPAVSDSPGLYRLRLIGSSLIRQYIGETVGLKRRFAHYVNPGPSQQTNIRINSILHDHLNSGAAIDIDVVTGGACIVVGAKTLEVEFRDKATRRLLENAAIVAGGGDRIETLNR